MQFYSGPPMHFLSGVDSWAENTTQSGYPLLFDDATCSALLRSRKRFNDSRWARTFAADYREFQDPLQAACFADLTTWLPDDLLVKYDKMAMAASLEGRCPYLTPSLVEWALRLPDRLKVAAPASKIVLREAFASVLPKPIGRRPKQGFLLPLDEYFQGRGRELLSDYVRVSLDEEVLRNDRLISLVDRQFASQSVNGRSLFALLLYKMWLVHAYGLPKFRPMPLADGIDWIGSASRRSKRRSSAREGQAALPRGGQFMMPSGGSAFYVVRHLKHSPSPFYALARR